RYPAALAAPLTTRTASAMPAPADSAQRPPLPGDSSPLPPHADRKAEKFEMNVDNALVAYAQAVFVSHIATGSQPGPAHVLAAVEESRGRCACLGGCEPLVAQEYGDHPDTAAPRMRWALQLAHTMSPSPVCATVNCG